MARGRGYGGGVVILTSTGADDGLLGSASTRAGRLASYTLSDHDDIRRQSRKQDKALLDDITSRLGSYHTSSDLGRTSRLHVVPYYGKGGTKSYVTYYGGDVYEGKQPRYESVTSSLRVLPPRYTPRSYSYSAGYVRPVRRDLDYLDLHTFRPTNRTRRFDYLDLSMPLDIHNYRDSGRYAPYTSYIPRYYRTSFDDMDTIYRPRHHSYLADVYSPMYNPYLEYDYDVPRPRSRSMYPYDYDLQLYPEVTSAPRRRSVSSYVHPSRTPLAPLRPSASYYDDIEWPDYRPSAIRFQPLRDGRAHGVGAPSSVGSTNLAVRNARRSLFRIERELGDYGYGDPYGGGSVVYDDDYVDYVPARRTTVTRTGGLTSLPPRPYLAGGTTTTTTVRRSTQPSPKSRIGDIEARLETQLLLEPYQPATQMSQLRTRAVDARSKMDRHKVLLDRYLPLPSGPIPDVEYEVENKYDELAQRMPSLGRLSHRADGGGASSSSSASLRPYSPAPRPRSNSYSGPPTRPSSRPPVSDVRKHCREVLCKTKGDPSYYRY